MKLRPILGSEEELKLEASISLQLGLSQHCFPAGREERKLPKPPIENTRIETVWKEEKCDIWKWKLAVN